MSIAPSKEDMAAFYEAQRAINPNAEKEGLPPAETAQQSNGLTEETPESMRFLQAVGDALDVPEQLTVKGCVITVDSPTLDDLINLFQTLRGNSSLTELANKAEKMGDQIEEKDMSAVLRTFPAARAMFLKAIHVEGKEFAHDDAKWNWYTKELDALSAVEILEMFEARTDWVKLVSKARRIMGKLLGMAAQAKELRRS